MASPQNFLIEQRPTFPIAIRKLLWMVCLTHCGVPQFKRYRSRDYSISTFIYCIINRVKSLTLRCFEDDTPIC